MNNARTDPQRHGVPYHPMASIEIWRKGCSCAPEGRAWECRECTEALIEAIENWFMDQ